MRLIKSHSAHTRLYTFSKLKGLKVCLGLPNRMTYIWDVISRAVIDIDDIDESMKMSCDIDIDIENEISICHTHCLRFATFAT